MEWDYELKDIDKIPMTGPIDPRVLDQGLFAVCVINDDIIKDRVIKHRVRTGLLSKSAITDHQFKPGLEWPLEM